MPHKLNHPLSSKFDEALQVASHLHREQARKGSQVPYISHVLGVAALVFEYDGTETQAIAALLHDVVEDCGGRPMLARIEEQFGHDVATIVKTCTDSFEVEGKRDWRERKEEHLRHLRNLDSGAAALLVVAADKLHNLTAIERDLLAVGQDVWRRFNAEPPDQFWYYGSVVEILERGLKNPIVQCLKETLERVRIAYRGRGISKAAMPPTTPEAFQRFGTSLNRLILDLPDRESIVDTLDYLLGAYYGLSRAQELGFQDRTTGQIPSYSAYVANDALAIAAGKPPNQVSLAGFYFNSSIQRLAAAFERIPKMLGAKKANAAEKMKEVNSGDYSNWERVYREVNDFKHKPEGRAFGRGVTMADAVAAFEQTLALLTKGSTTLKARYR